jgi:hypothetical protein
MGARHDEAVFPLSSAIAGAARGTIAAELDRRGIKSWSGKPWNAVSVRNAMVRLGFQTNSR